MVSVQRIALRVPYLTKGRGGAGTPLIPRDTFSQKRIAERLKESKDTVLFLEKEAIASKPIFTKIVKEVAEHPDARFVRGEKKQGVESLPEFLGYDKNGLPVFKQVKRRK